MHGKKLWKKEKMLVTSIFSFSHNVFNRLLSQGLKSPDCVVRVHPFPHKPWFLPVCRTFKNTVRKGEIARSKKGSFSCSVFYPFGELSAIFIKIKIIIYKLFHFGTEE